MQNIYVVMMNLKFSQHFVIESVAKQFSFSLSVDIAELYMYKISSQRWNQKCYLNNQKCFWCVILWIPSIQIRWLNFKVFRWFRFFQVISSRELEVSVHHDRMVIPSKYPPDGKMSNRQIFLLVLRSNDQFSII